MNSVNVLLQRGRLALQEFGPSMAMLTLPGGYLVALSGLILRRWPLAAGRWPLAAGRSARGQAER